MDTSKVSFGEMVAGASAAALFIIMFLPWYGGKATGSVPGAGSFSVSGGNVSAWEAFSFIDILLFLVVLVVIALTVAKAMGSAPDLPAPAGQIVAIAGGIAVVLILFRILSTPGADVSGARGRHRGHPQDRRLPRPDRGRRHHVRRLHGDERARAG